MCCVSNNNGFVWRAQCGGLDVVYRVLCDSGSQADMEEKSEAAGLLAQITSPWLDPPEGDGTNMHSWPTLDLSPYIAAFIAALTGKTYRPTRSLFN